jgi:hypothetical protein
MLFVAFMQKTDEDSFRKFLISIEDGKDFSTALVSAYNQKVPDLWGKFTQGERKGVNSPYSIFDRESDRMSQPNRRTSEPGHPLARSAETEMKMINMPSLVVFLHHRPRRHRLLPDGEKCGRRLRLHGCRGNDFLSPDFLDHMRVWMQTRITSSGDLDTVAGF